MSRFWILVACFSWIASLPAFAQAPPDDVGDLTLDQDVLGEADELLLFEDIPIVVSASRQSTPINLSSVPISVVSEETTHLSGITRVEQIFDFIPGMDVLRFDKNRYGFGVRGLHAVIGDRTLGLVDGRAVTDPIWGSPDFQRLPLLVEDIERIEVVRGPGGGAWGANAFQGVIDIITKDLDQTQGTLTSVTLDEYGDRYAQLRLGGASENWGYRLTGSYQHAESSDEDIGGVIAGFVGIPLGESRDFSRVFRLGGEAERRFSDENKLGLGLGYSYQRLGPYESLGLPNPVTGASDDHLRSLRGHARMERTNGPGSSWYLQYLGTLDSYDRSGLDAWATENSLETQIDWKPSAAHQSSVGAVANSTLLDTDPQSVADIQFQGGTVHEEWVGIFGLDRWQASDRFTVEGQLRGDYYSETGFDWSGRLAGLWALDHEKDHILRLSAARSFRAPRIGYRELQTQRYPLPPPVGGNLLTFVPTSNLENERIWSLEAGTSSTLAPGVTLRVDGYWQRFERLIGAASTIDGFGRVTTVLDNLGQAQGYGAEAEIAVSRDRFDVSVWYALNAFDHDDATASVRAALPARQKIGASVTYHLPWGLHLWTAFKHATTTKADVVTGNRFPGYSRLDVTLSRRFFEDRAEVLIGVRDLLDETGFAVNDVSSLAAHENDGRIYFLRGEIAF